MSRTRVAALALSLGVSAFALGACQAIAGIEDRTYVAAGGGSNVTTTSAECQEYCAKSREVCGDLLYRTADTCLATCALMPLKGANTNSVACRTQELERALLTQEDTEKYCASAGPGGNGVCGSNCENYCELYAQACTDGFKKYNMLAVENGAAEDDTAAALAVCVSKCEGLVDTHLYDSTNEGNYSGDTLQCRLVHTTSSTIDPGGHCDHADLKSNKCVDDAESEPDCANFCQLEMTECADYPIYEDKQQCMAVCKALPPGHPGDISENTVACRVYHSYNSIIDPENHCPHTGPGGDGHCSTDHAKDNKGNCESYCILLQKACEADFDQRFDDQDACQAECEDIDGAVYDSGYSTSAKGNNVQCRLLHVSRALSKPSECAAALGGSPCK